MTALANRTCSICGQTLEARDPKGYGIALREHTRTVHPELFRWQRRMRVTAVIAVGLGATLGIVSAIFLQNVGYNNWAEAVLFAALLRSGPPILVPYDGCVFEKGTIILPLSSQDKLDTEEWIPLIISELLYQQKFRAKRRVGLLIRIVPLTIVYLIIPAVLWQLGIINLNGMTTYRGSPTPFWLAFYGIYSGTALIFAMILQIILGFRFEKKLRLLSDQQTAAMTQKQLFLSGLGKIGRAFPEVMREKRPSISYPPGRPGIPRRISIVEATGLIGYSMSSS